MNHTVGGGHNGNVGGSEEQEEMVLLTLFQKNKAFIALKTVKSIFS